VALNDSGLQLKMGMACTGRVKTLLIQQSPGFRTCQTASGEGSCIDLNECEEWKWPSTKCHTLISQDRF